MFDLSAAAFLFPLACTAAVALWATRILFRM